MIGKKQKRKLFLVAILTLAWTTSAQAILIDNGDGTITDTETQLMWMQDTTLKGPGGFGFEWNDATALVETLTLGGHDDWRLPTALDNNGNICIGFDCTDTEFGSLYYEALGNSAGALTNSGVFNIDLVDGSWFWTSTYVGQVTCLFCSPKDAYDVAHQFRFEVGEQRDYDLSVSFPSPDQPVFGYIWAVRDITPNAQIPEPQVWMLMSLGLCLIAARKITQSSRLS